MSLSPLRLAASRWGLIKPLVPALLMFAPLSMTVGLVGQGHAHDGERVLVAEVVTVDKEPRAGLLVDLDPTYHVTLRLPEGGRREIAQQVAVSEGDDLRVFSDGYSVRSSTEYSVGLRAAQIGILTTFLGLSTLAGWVSYRRQVARVRRC